MTGPSEPVPALRVVRGTPTAEELAAVLALVTAAGAAPSDPPAAVVRGGWADPSARVRRPLTAGPGGWAASR